MCAWACLLGQVVRELVKAGVDVGKVETFSGLTALELVETTLGDPSCNKQQSRRLRSVFKILKAAETARSANAGGVQATPIRAAAAKLAAVISNRDCAVCQAPKCKLRCPCSMRLYYCSKECQKNHWKIHKTEHNARTHNKQLHVRPKSILVDQDTLGYKGAEDVVIVTSASAAHAHKITTQQWKCDGRNLCTTFSSIQIFITLQMLCYVVYWWSALQSCDITGM